jgi:hypothetical protein
MALRNDGMARSFSSYIYAMNVGRYK